MGHGAGYLTSFDFENTWMSSKSRTDPSLEISASGDPGSAPPAPHERFTGYGDGPENWARTKKMLSRLAQLMRIGTTPREDLDNPLIPAGYTYLAQLVAHDVVATAQSFPQPGKANTEFRNFRGRPLVLDCIYGAGPDLTPTPYESRQAGELRRKLRLGRIRTKENTLKEPNGPQRDIPRVGCPYIDDVLTTGNPGRVYPTDDLIADQRNGDNVLVSQLTALFHHFHNAVLEQVDHLRPPFKNKNGEPDKMIEHRNFDLSRRSVIRIYRSIIRYDLLSLILNDRVYHNFLNQERLSSIRCIEKSTFISKNSDQTERNDHKIPLEFSHAAYRFGHAMAHTDYILNSKNREATLGEIINQTSARDPMHMPLSPSWVVDNWWRFFSISGHEEANPSRRITPQITKHLISGNSFQAADGSAGNLIYLDLVRGASAGLRSVASLLQRHGLDRQPEYSLADPTCRANKINEWIEKAEHVGAPLITSSEDRLSNRDKTLLCTDPPLLFFILLEAAETDQSIVIDGREEKSRGARLGPLGSILVAETLFHALFKTRDFDQEEKEEDDKILLHQIFGLDKISSMSELISWLQVEQDWVDYKLFDEGLVSRKGEG